MRYEFEWQYNDEMEAGPGSEPYIHFTFMLRFRDVPVGAKGHVAHFCFNVLRNSETNESGITVVRKGFLSCLPLSKTLILSFVEATVAETFEKSMREEAIAYLNKIFIHEDTDFADEFVDDLVEKDELLALIENAFNGVEREDGITLHEAAVIDDYGSEEEFVAARNLDTDSRWQDVPDSDISNHTSIYCFLDPKGFRYYLPASMSWAVKHYEEDENDCGFFTYLAVLPSVAPREVGRGIGSSFDLDAFIKKHSFTPLQVKAIYRFICFMAIKADVGMNEDYYAATKKWRLAARIE
jgi:hypothetical protein